MAQEMYAFGDSKVSGVLCVARAAGRELVDKELTVAEEYDEVVRLRYGIDEGILPAGIAESCWEEAVESVLSNARYYEREDPEHSEYLYDAADVGKRIASEVF